MFACRAPNALSSGTQIDERPTNTFRVMIRSAQGDFGRKGRIHAWGFISATLRWRRQVWMFKSAHTAGGPEVRSRGV